jgi:hypothetical protein
MATPSTARRTGARLSRRELLQAGLAAGAMFARWPLGRPPLLWGGEAGHPRRGGVLRVRGFAPPNLDPHLTSAGFTRVITLSGVAVFVSRQPREESTDGGSSHRGPQTTSHMLLERPFAPA